MKVENINIILIVAILSFLSMFAMELPGLYLDAVNPDYLSVHLVHPDNVPTWTYPDNMIFKVFPILNSLYGINTTGYIMLPWSLIFGSDVYSIRILHVLYIMFMLYFFYSVIRCVTNNNSVALVGMIFLGIEPSIMFATRTQYYLQLFPHIFFFAGIMFLINGIFNEKLSKYFLYSFILLGFSAANYFIFAFYLVAVFIITGIYLYKLNSTHNLRMCFKGAFIGYFPFLFAHLSIVCSGQVFL